MRVVGTLGAVIGLLTGVGTLIGWIASSNTLGDVGSTALVIAGAAIMVGLPVSIVLEELGREGGLDWGEIFWVALGLGVAVLVLVEEEPGEVLRFYGWMALAIGLAWCVFQLPAYLRRASGKKCPQCAETVKADARVCRFCGWRFEEVPTQTGNALNR
jgi:hypothetical protein